MNKKQLSMFNAYTSSKIRTIEQAYTRPSTNKIRAYEQCLQDMCAHNGFDFRITGISSHYFSCAYQYLDSDGQLRLVYHTHANRYCFVIS